MTVNPIFQPHAANSSTGSSSNSPGVTNDTFMQLLITQLQNQSPLDPVDPNQFVNQLVQFNTLNEVIGIHQILQQSAGTGTSGSSTTH